MTSCFVRMCRLSRPPRTLAQLMSEGRCEEALRLISRLRSMDQIIVFLDICNNDYRNRSRFQLDPVARVVDASLGKVDPEEFCREFTHFEQRVIVQATLCRAEAPASPAFKRYLFTMASLLSAVCMRECGASLLFAVIEGLVPEDIPMEESKFTPFNWWLPRNMMLARAALTVSVRVGLTTQEPYAYDMAFPVDQPYLNCPFSLCVRYGLFLEAVLLYDTGAVSSAELDLLTPRRRRRRPDTQMVHFLVKVCRQPRSLRSLSGFALSRLIGCRAGRDERAEALDLPPVLRDSAVLFKGHVQDYVQRTLESCRGRVPPAVVQRFLQTVSVD